jgi:Reverse transcriptase (RNA-dependent DNA polymerase)
VLRADGRGCGGGGRVGAGGVEIRSEVVKDGREWVADIDLDRFLDRVQLDVLMARVARKAAGRKILKLIRSYLEAGMMAGGVKQATAEGTPQGSPLSPILSNIILDDLDWELEQRGHRFVRYAKEWKTTAAKRHNLRIRGISESSARKWGGAAGDAGGPCCRRACEDPPPEPPISPGEALRAHMELGTPGPAMNGSLALRSFAGAA